MLLILALAAAGVEAAGDPRLDPVRRQLSADGFDADWIDKIYARPGVAFDVGGATSYFRHRERALNYKQFTTAQSIDSARSYLDAHTEALARTEAAYGVDREIIAAILLVETRLGTYVGKSATLNILSSMAALADPGVRAQVWKEMARSPRMKRTDFDRWSRKKSRWAYTELKAFLTYTAREDMDPVAVTGSYAGALGIAQFMPTSILDYAADGNEDGRVNLFQHEDAIASVGRYLKRNGWRSGMTRTQASKVLYRYNRSEYYVKTILTIADRLKG